MACYKDVIGIFFVSFTYLILFAQVYLVYSSTDIYSEVHFSQISDISLISYLLIYKIIFYIIFVLCFLSHFRCMITEPGKITHLNNYAMIQFYYEIHTNSMINAQKLTNQQGDNLKKKIEKINEESSDIDSSFSEEDSYVYEKVTSINDEIMDDIKHKYKMKLERCFQCFIVRPIKTHHCATCRGCILDMHHHCPWVNNCIGCFNKKFFILFNFYSFWGNILSLFICCYYLLYKNYENLNNAKIIIHVVLQILISVVFMIFNIILMKEQYENIDNNLLYCDYKELKLLEKTTIYDELYLIFGGDFGIGWFLPFRCGGFRNLYRVIYKSIYENNNENKED